MYFAYLAAGVLTGLCSGMFGIGGGVILVPMLVLLFQFPQHVASGTSLVAMLLPVGALGVWEYYKAGKITSTHMKVGLLVAVGIFLGTFLGSRVSIAISDTTLRKGFAAFLILISARLFFL